MTAGYSATGRHWVRVALEAIATGIASSGDDRWDIGYRHRDGAEAARAGDRIQRGAIAAVPASGGIAPSPMCYYEAAGELTMPYRDRAATP
jgi:hypothetical protein